jgi:hypothetical protein
VQLRASRNTCVIPDIYILSCFALFCSSFWLLAPRLLNFISNMQQVFSIFNALLRVGLLPVVLAAPAPQADYAQQSGPLAGIDTPIPTVTSISGSLYGPQSLLGEIAQASPVSGGDSAVVSDYPLVNGQEANSDLGLYLDFNSVPNPQPIRGDGGQTQPGPR